MKSAKIDTGATDVEMIAATENAANILDEISKMSKIVAKEA